MRAAMAELQVLQHVAMEGPARIAAVAEELGLGVQIHRLHEGAPVPKSVATGDVLVVMGGSMGVGDVGDRRWPFLAAEAELLSTVLPRGTAVIGVCLGAQLMAHALGAKVYPAMVGDPPVRHREVGWGAITFTASSADEPSLLGMEDSEVVLHWHGDTFDLPEGAVRLASTLPCPNQMFRYGRRAFALQFHVEIEAPEVERWAREDADFVRAANGPAGAARILADTARWMPRHRLVGDRLIRNMLSLCL
jgi:GMP synthase-like glutamine amidotransferase